MTWALTAAVGIAWCLSIGTVILAVEYGYQLGDDRRHGDERCASAVALAIVASSALAFWVGAIILASPGPT